ncbi:MAG: hypothetical protein IKM65_08785 [Bacteroidaceae bacterium]|nr:hypothetical protein [Bacteroidaceae bacterium]
MMRKVFPFLCLLLAGACRTASTPMASETSDTICVRLATIDEAKALIAAEDSYTRSRSTFDIVSRLQNPEGTIEQLDSMMLDGVRRWNRADSIALNSIVAALNDTIRKYNIKLPLPKEIMLVKSTMADEGGAAGYTRSNWIALSHNFAEFPDEFKRELLLHEIFHVLTRRSIDFKRRMYATIGFTVTEDELPYPADIKERRISNPDVGRYDSYATFTIDGEPQKCAMLLYATRPYAGGTFFSYLGIGLIPYDENLIPVQRGDATVVYSPQDATDFFEKVGRNTQYIINPEEILADNFVIAFNNRASVPTPELRDRIRALLLGK